MQKTLKTLGRIKWDHTLDSLPRGPRNFSSATKGFYTSWNNTKEKGKQKMEILYHSTILL